MEAWRESVVSEAKRWLRTPWRHDAEVLGGGIDCGHLLRACYVGAGLVEPFVIEPYPADWMLHRSEERFLGIVERFLDRFDGPPLPGDVAVWRYGRCFSHGAVVVAWPSVIHAFRKDRAVVWGDATKGFLAARDEVRFYTLAGRL